MVSQDQVKQQLNSFYNIVEKAITQIGVDPSTARNEGGKWTLRKGKTLVWVRVDYVPREKRIYFEAAAPVMDIPENANADFFRKMLEMNIKVYGVAFGEYQNKIYLRTIREAPGLDVSEALSMILRVGNYADYYSKELKKENPAWIPTFS